MNIKKLIVAVIMLVLVGLLSLVAVDYISYRIQKIENAHRESFYYNLVASVEADEDFDMAEITPFDWDRMYIIRPYTSQKEMQKTIGLRWTTAHSYLGYLIERKTGEYQLSDDMFYKLVFVKDDRVVLDITLMRKEADFTPNRELILRERARFTVDKTDGMYPIVLERS